LGHEVHEALARLGDRRQDRVAHLSGSTPFPLTAIAVTPAATSPRSPPTMAAATFCASSGTSKPGLRSARPLAATYPHAPIHAAHQRQSRALHPNPAARVGVPQCPGHLGPPSPCSYPMAALLRRPNRSAGLGRTVDDVRVDGEGRHPEEN